MEKEEEGTGQLTCPAGSLRPSLTLPGSVLDVEDMATFSSGFTPSTALSTSLFSARKYGGSSPPACAAAVCKARTELARSAAVCRLENRCGPTDAIAHHCKSRLLTRGFLTCCSKIPWTRSSDFSYCLLQASSRTHRSFTPGRLGKLNCAFLELL